MALPAIDLLAAIKAALGPAAVGGLHRLAVNDRRRRTRLTASTQTDLLAQQAVDLFPDAGFAPVAEVVIDSFPTRKFVWQQAPGTAGADQVEDGLEDLAHIVLARPPSWLCRRDQWRQLIPLCISQICRIFSAIHQQRLLLCHFSDTL